ncbi:MAG: type II CAAX prenyl endopeptidase Rce1 family protein [Thermoguttaceae bacterium]
MRHAGEQLVTFACEECGESITFPAERCGHVETCPSCGAYVDVPDDIESPLPTDGKVSGSQPIAQEAEPTKVPIPDSRTTSQLWIEVLAVLCLAYFPYLFSAIAFFGQGSGDAPSIYRELSWIVNSIRTSVPLLMILMLTKDRWSLFGIVRPIWITDAAVGCIIFLGDKLAYRFVLTSLPRSLVESAANLHSAHRVQPDGLPAYFLLLVGCIAVGFAEELVMRGYLIPRLEHLLRSTWLAVLVTSALFASCHVYQGVAPAIGIFASALVYAVSFCLLRRLWPLCVAHALVDFTAYF